MDMCIAIMQPYFFPYLGYFQLIKAVDKFVLYNDVNFIKRGWINRNRILVNGKDKLITVPVQDASQNRLIYDTLVVEDQLGIERNFRLIEMAYRNAPYRREVLPLVEDVFRMKASSIDQLARWSIEVVADYLEIQTMIIESKGRYGNERLTKADRLIDICVKEGLQTYVNPPGGKELYTKAYFEQRGINLKFIESKPISYRQFDDNFIGSLSIIDVLMFNNRSRVQDFLNEYQLV